MAVAYLPDNDQIAIDMSAFPGPMTVKWYDPVHGTYTSVPGSVPNEGEHSFARPGNGDWVLLLRRAG